MKQNLLLFISVLLLCLGSMDMKGQTQRVSGTVVDEDNVPLLGVAVMIKGTTKGVITGSDGKYAIEAKRSDSLQFSFIGYLTEELKVDMRSTIDLKMRPDAVNIEEVQVVAYGQQKKVSIVGAISSVSTEDIVSSPTGSVANSLAGKVTGLTAIQSSGQPGADDPDIFVRGIGTLTEDNSAPLMIVDGVERSFSQLDPEEIQDISLLKDASATAVYGIRGGNGVILVTTKRGRTGRPVISVSGSYSLQTPTKLLDFADSYTYAMVRNNAEFTDGTVDSVEDGEFSQEAIAAFRDGTDPLIYPNIDWMDYLMKDFSSQHKENVNISGGTKKVKYFVSFGFFSQDGQLNDFGSTDYDYNFGYNRFNYRSNLDIKVTNTTSVDLTIGGRSTSQSQPNTKDGLDQLWRQIYWAVPFSGAGIVDDKYLLTNDDYITQQKKDGLDPFYGRGYKDLTSNVLNLDLALKQDLKSITEGLKIHIKGAYNTTYNHNKTRSTSIRTYSPVYLKDVDDSVSEEDTNANNIVYKTNGTNGTLGYSESTGKERNWYLEGALNYSRSFGSHNVTGLLLYNQRRNYYPSTYSDLPKGYVGIAARATYNYQTKYLMEFNIGYNGSENFAEGNRFGLFPAMSAGWIITEEDFMQSQSAISYLKLRASVGLVGNDKQGSSRFLYLPDSYDPSSTGYNFGVDVPSKQNGASESQIGNSDVTWETATKQNYGVDMKLFQDKLSINLDYFFSNRKDILITRETVPGYVAASLPAVNMGKVENSGFEVSLSWRQKISDFTYFVNANVSHARNKILYKDEVKPNELYLAETGKSVGQHFGLTTDGFWQEDEFGEDGFVKEGSVAYLVPKPGDVKYVDLNGDLVIDNDDRGPIGYSNVPQTNLGLTVGFKYRRFDMKTVWAGATNVSRELSETYSTAFGATGNRSLLQYLVDGAWTPENANDALYPRISITNRDRNITKSDLWVRDASYVRLKNVEIAYNLNPKWVKGAGIKSMRVYLSGYNLLTWDNIKITDPEAKTGSDSVYPVMKVYNFGVNLKF